MTVVHTPPDADLPGEFAGLGTDARRWLTAARASATARDTDWELRFAEAGRRCGTEHADAARVLLLAAARPDAETVTLLYHRGTAAERRAVLLALDGLDTETRPSSCRSRRTPAPQRHQPRSSAPSPLRARTPDAHQ
ncbi:hypothetical protein [Streptomyces sp. DHE17-7]|uniref:hypothetical protein n=1 Tax=Streptomyces sp. DHE17-7 TaxID=2759949 RepID=UPI002FCE41C1